MNKMYLVIMAGGIGSRFWPASRTTVPKQFLDIMSTGKSLLQMTYSRFEPICPKENMFVVTSDEYSELVQMHMPFLTDEQILKEPMRRNTAPCVAYAAEKILAKDKDAVMVVVPADHLILNEHKFLSVIEECVRFVIQKEALVTIGIKPTKPATTYGYIQCNEEKKEGNFFPVKTFTEKPSIDIAKSFLKSGDFLWNSGMFIWKAKTIHDALNKHLPEVMDCFAGGEKVYNTAQEAAFIEKAYSQCTNISIDYGVMEKAENVYTIPADFGWSDIGTWDSLHEVFEKDYLGNAVIGNNVKIYNSSNNMISVPREKLVVLHGLEGMCIVDTKDVLLIFQKDKQDEFKEITIDLKKEDLDKFL